MITHTAKQLITIYTIIDKLITHCNMWERNQSTISPLLLSKLSDSSILQISVRFDSLGNVDDHLGSDEEEEAPAALSIMLW